MIEGRCRLRVEPHPPHEWRAEGMLTLDPPTFRCPGIPPQPLADEPVAPGAALMAYHRRLALERQEQARRRYMQRRYDAAAAAGKIL